MSERIDHSSLQLILAKLGIQIERHSRESGNPGNRARHHLWTPAYAGVTAHN